MPDPRFSRGRQAKALRPCIRVRRPAPACAQENDKRPEITTTESGLQYEVIEAGTGETPTDASTVKVHYEGKLIDGTVFDSSMARGQPTEFPVNRVIKGWTEALCLMQVCPFAWGAGDGQGVGLPTRGVNGRQWNCASYHQQHHKAEAS